MNVESIIQLIYADKLLTKLRKKIEAGLGTFKDTTDYCNRSAELLGRLFSENVLSMSDVERITANDTLLKDRYKDINDLLDKVQRTVDKAQGINIRPQHAPFNQERADQIGRSLTDKTVSEETIQRRAGSAPATMTRAMQDDYVEENAKFRSDAGLKTYLVRVTDGDCCEWCNKVAGRYEYGTEPHDIYRRHDNCGCSVTYENGRQRQNVWTKKTWEVPAEDAGAPEPVRLTKEQAAAAGAPPPKVFSVGEARELEKELMFASMPGKDDSAIANLDYINGKEFADKFKGKYANEDVENAVIKACRQLVKNRNGTLFEEAFFIDAETGKTISYVKGKKKNSVNLNKKLKKVLTNANEKSIIMIHNHPNSSPFSRADFLTSSDYESCFETVAVGHNGDVYSFRNTYGTRGEFLGYFEENGKQYPYYEAIRDYRIAYSKHSARGQNDFDARNSAWKDVSEMRGFIYEKR